MERNDMKTESAGDARLNHLLREARPGVELVPRFREAVWRRIESVAASQTQRSMTWLEQFVAWMTQPRHALAGVAALVLVGIGLGLAEGGSLAHDLARDRYLAAVSPTATH